MAEMAAGAEIPPVAVALRQLPGATPEEFGRVEQLLIGSLRTLGGWRWSMAYPTRGEIVRALRVASSADDPEQAYIGAAAEIALICDQILIPLVPPLALHTRTLTTEEIDAIHTYTDPATAGYQLAKLITRLPDEMLALVGASR